MTEKRVVCGPSQLSSFLPSECVGNFGHMRESHGPKNVVLVPQNRIDGKTPEEQQQQHRDSSILQ